MVFLKRSTAILIGSLSVPHLLSSTQQFLTKRPLFSAPKNPSVQQKKPDFNTYLSSTSKNRQFNNQNPSDQHTHQFRKLSSQHVSSTFIVLNWGVFWTVKCVELTVFVCWTERCAELKGFWCWTDEFWLLKRRGPCAELRGSV